MTNLATIERTNLPAAPTSIVNLYDFKQVCDFAKMIADTELVPQHFQKSPQAVVVAIQWGLEIGVPPMQALQNIAVINGRPSIWGDLGKAIVQAHPELAGYSEKYNAELKVAFVTIKRRRANGAEIEITGDFSWQDAVDAKLSGKNTYQQYARDMLMWRAFWRAARATFADALRGLSGAEESRDLEVVKSAKVSGMSDGAADLNEALAKPHEQTPAEERQPGKTTPLTPLPEMKTRPATQEDLERGSGLNPHEAQRESMEKGEPHVSPAGQPPTGADPLPPAAATPKKDVLVMECENQLDMLGIQRGSWLATVRELGIAVPEKAATLKGLPVPDLIKLDNALRKELAGG